MNALDKAIKATDVGSVLNIDYAKKVMEQQVKAAKEAKKLNGMTDPKYGELLNSKIKVLEEIEDELYKDYQELKRYCSDCKNAIYNMQRGK